MECKYLLVFILSTVSLSLLFNKIQNIENGQQQILVELSNLRWTDSGRERNNKPVAWVRGQVGSHDYLHHVKSSFRRVGYNVVEGDAEPEKWDVFWSHEYPFTTFRHVIHNMGPNQLANHIPGSVYYTFKVFLATAGLNRGIPKSFALPDEKQRFLDYSTMHSHSQWVQKGNAHREIRVLPAESLDLDRKDSFVQQFVHNPLLIDGKKFDLGVYVVVTSLSPLRVYIYEDEFLLRFCPEPYEPFDPAHLDKYVVADDYTPIWEMPAFNHSYNIQKLSFKQSLAQHLAKAGKSIGPIVKQMRSIIAEVFQRLNYKMRGQIAQTVRAGRFFELSRFDFLVDEDLNVYLMEANMSPNLSSDHFQPNALLYEQVLINLFGLVGIAQSYRRTGLDNSDLSLRRVESPSRSINIDLPICANSTCSTCPDSLDNCKLCASCMPDSLRYHLENAYLEHTGRREMRRVVPVPGNDLLQDQLTDVDLLQQVWFEEKCKVEQSFCS